MSLTSNFDYCIQLGIAQVREIFHLAFKSEDRYPHNVGPISRTFSGRNMIINVRVHDDEDRAADLTFQDEKHMRFSFPFDLTAEVEDAPDPALSRVTLQVRVEVPGRLDTWVETEEVLGISFFDITPVDVNIVTLDGLPAIDIGNFLAAIHNRYDEIPHVYTDGSGGELILYDGNRDTTLVPPNSGGQEIAAALENHGGHEYLKITAPIHVIVPLPSGGEYSSYGDVIFWREVIHTDTTITVEMGTEPATPRCRRRSSWTTWGARRQPSRPASRPSCTPPTRPGPSPTAARWVVPRCRSTTARATPIWSRPTPATLKSPAPWKRTAATNIST
jgi:hypothetical protein